MNCRTCQHELSEYLDGRLGSGRRAQVLDHMSACEPCSRFWHELQRAQQIASRLPRERTGPDFRERLFARIEAGEGSPPAVFQEPVSVGARIRYMFVGAAAAAAALFVASMLKDDGAPRLSQPSEQSIALANPSSGASKPRIDAEPRPAQFANDPREPAYVASADASPLAPRRQDAMLSAVKPLTSELLAVETARQFEQRHKWTSHCLALLDSGAADEAMVGKIYDDAESLSRLGGVLTELRDAKCLSFGDPQVDSDLRVFVTLLDRDRMRQNGRGIVSVREVVGPALRKSNSLSRLTTALSVTPSFDRGGEQQHVLRIARSWPELLDQIFFVLPNVPDAAQMHPLELSRTFVFSDDCGPVYVAPMSEIEGPEAVFRRLRGVVGVRIEAAGSGR